MTKAVIFDLEGTLLTTRECRIRAWSQTAREQGIQCDENLLHRMAHARAPQALEIMLTRSHRLYQPAEKLALGEVRSAAKLRACKELLLAEWQRLYEENKQYA